MEDEAMTSDRDSGALEFVRVSGSRGMFEVYCGVHAGRLFEVAVNLAKGRLGGSVCMSQNMRVTDHGATSTTHRATARLGGGAWETSQELGEGPSPEAIAHGTVRMEDHPNFATLIEEASSKGAAIKYGERAHVELVHVVDDIGEILEVRRELHLVPGMRYLDLEHEMGHLRQLERFGDAPPPTRKVVKHGEIEKNVQGSLASGQLTVHQNSIIEYHNRLQEYIRLAARKVSLPILEEHAEGLDHWRRKAEMGGLGRAGSLNEWAQRYFQDIPALEARCRELGLALVPKTSRW